MNNKNNIFNVNIGLDFRIGRSKIFFPALGKDVSDDVHLFPAQRDGTSRVGLE